jgi:hypothetical protein
MKKESRYEIFQKLTAADLNYRPGEAYSHPNEEYMRSDFSRHYRYDVQEIAKIQPLTWQVQGGAASKSFFKLLEVETEKAIKANKFRNLKDD